MFWYILLTISLITLLWLLLAPVIIYASTPEQIYMIKLPGIFKAQLLPWEGLFMIKGFVFFIPYRFKPFHRKRKKTRTKREKPVRKRTGFDKRKGLLMGRKILHAFSIKKLHLNIDTDDFTLNAWLIPVFSALESENIKLRANFEGHTSVLLDIRTHLGAIIWAFAKSKYNLVLNQ